MSIVIWSESRDIARIRPIPAFLLVVIIWVKIRITSSNAQTRLRDRVNRALIRLIHARPSFQIVSVWMVFESS